MKEYTFVIIITEHKISAFNIKDKAAIPIKGEPVISYAVIDDLTAFNTELKNYFNFNTYADCETAITIVNAGADNNFVHALFDLIKDAAETNLIDASYFLPLLYAASGNITENTIATYDLFGTFYAVNVDEQKQITCTLSKAAKNAKSVDPEQFTLLFSLDARNLGTDMAAIESETAKNNALREKVATLEDHIKSLEPSLEELVRLKHDNNEAEKLRNLENTIYIADYDADPELYLSSNELPFNKHQEVIFYKRIAKGARVNKGDVIGMYANKDSRSYKVVTAKKSGKLFYLIEDSAELHDGDGVAVIGSNTWTDDHALSFYNDTVNALRESMQKKRSAEESEQAHNADQKCETEGVIIKAHNLKNIEKYKPASALRIKYKKNIENGASVQKDQAIFFLNQEYLSAPEQYDFPVYAPCSGKFFFVKYCSKNEEEKEADIVEGESLAIIVPEAWTKQEAVEWFRNTEPLKEPYQRGYDRPTLVRMSILFPIFSNGIDVSKEFSFENGDFVLPDDSVFCKSNEENSEDNKCKKAGRILYRSNQASSYNDSLITIKIY